MKYISTRGAAPAITFEDVLVSGLAPDGGLFVPESWPQLDYRRLQGKPGLTYATVAASVLALFASDPRWYEAIQSATNEAYAKFSHPQTAPLRELGPHRWLLELFHGPTLAFKDFALQVLAPLMNEALKRKGTRTLVIAATSGDTGAAAVEALSGRSNIDLIVLHPKGRISDVQRRQMTTSKALNIKNIAVEGTFDDAQAMVKAMFADQDFARKHNLSAINSINWVRIAVQAAYYISSGLALNRKNIWYAVPTGNFGDAFAGIVAKRMGAPIGKIVVATNDNNIVAEAITTGIYRRGKVHATMSPAMDIQVASNFERLLFEHMGRNGAAVATTMRAFESTGELLLQPAVLESIRGELVADHVNEGETAATIKTVHQHTGLLVDPHTAVGLTATRIAPESQDVVALATAHPAKFPEAIARAAGLNPVLPERLRWMLTAEERYSTIPASAQALRNFIETAVNFN